MFITNIAALIKLYKSHLKRMWAGAVYVYHGATVLLFITVLLVLVDKVRLAY